MLQNIKISDSFQPQNMQIKLKFYLEDFPVKISQFPEKELVFMGRKVACGQNSIESLKRYNLSMSLLKIHLDYLEKASKKCYMIFPKAGTTQNGNVYALPIMDIRIKENGCILLPTPLHRDGKGYYICSKEASLKRIKKQMHWIHNAILFYNLKKGFANPQFSEWMMGYPKNWTLLID